MKYTWRMFCVYIYLGVCECVRERKRGLLGSRRVGEGRSGMRERWSRYPKRRSRGYIKIKQAYTVNKEKK